MTELMVSSAFFGTVLSLLAYFAGTALKNKFKLAIFNPILIGVLICIAFLKITSVSYDSYYASAKYLGWFLTPATVCLAIPLYEQLNLLKENFTAIAVGIISGVLTSVLTVLILALIFNLTHEQYTTLLPKSVTSPIGMGIAQELGGIPSITVPVIILSGLVGNVIAEPFLKLIGVTNPVAKGIAIGSSSHALGTAKAMEMGEVEGAMSSLSIAVSGLLTVVAASIFGGFI